MTEVRDYVHATDGLVLGVNDTDAQLEAHCAWSRAKMTLVAEAYGLPDDEALACHLDVAPGDARERIMLEIWNMPVDPVTGSGLH